MIYQSLSQRLSQLFGSNRYSACCYESCSSDSDCPACGEGSGYSCLCRCSNPCCPCDLDGYNVKKLCWTKIVTCSCDREQASALTENGFDDSRGDPVAVSAEFLNNSCVPCAFRGKPAYLKCKRCIGDKTYVLLGISCVGDIAFELDKTTTCSGSCIYTVCRIAPIPQC